jgi:hypothetical protein
MYGTVVHEDVKNKVLTCCVHARCVSCNTLHVLQIPESKWSDLNSKSGGFIQDVLPNLSADERELLISGMCGKCFNTLFEEIQ